MNSVPRHKPQKKSVSSLLLKVNKLEASTRLFDSHGNESLHFIAFRHAAKALSASLAIPHMGCWNAHVRHANMEIQKSFATFSHVKGVDGANQIMESHRIKL